MDIPDIKQHLTLSQLLQYYGLKPDKNGRLNCPFHEDKTPSPAPAGCITKPTQCIASAAIAKHTAKAWM
jgi:hypothetical protein